MESMVQQVDCSHSGTPGAPCGSARTAWAPACPRNRGPGQEAKRKGRRRPGYAAARSGRLCGGRGRVGSAGRRAARQEGLRGAASARPCGMVRGPGVAPGPSGQGCGAGCGAAACRWAKARQAAHVPCCGAVSSEGASDAAEADGLPLSPAAAVTPCRRHRRRHGGLQGLSQVRRLMPRPAQAGIQPQGQQQEGREAVRSHGSFRSAG